MNRVVGLAYSVGFHEQETKQIDKIESQSVHTCQKCLTCETMVLDEMWKNNAFSRG